MVETLNKTLNERARRAQKPARPGPRSADPHANEENRNLSNGGAGPAHGHDQQSTGKITAYPK